jgi:D-sedoheptulose 7-phosphate isomerase
VAEPPAGGQDRAPDLAKVVPALVSDRIAEFVGVAEALSDRELREQVTAVAGLFVQTVRDGHVLLFAGNGGSASQAAHAAAEFVGRCTRDRGPLPALALTDPVVLTAIANDYGYPEVFARQVRAHARSGDLLVVLSTSGHSSNVLRALDEARALGVVTVALTGGDAGLLPGRADHVLVAPSARTGRIQEVHDLWCHVFAEAVEVCLGAT